MSRAMLFALGLCACAAAPPPRPEAQCGAPPRPSSGNNVYGDQGSSRSRQPYSSAPQPVQSP